MKKNKVLVVYGSHIGDKTIKTLGSIKDLAARLNILRNNNFILRKIAVKNRSDRLAISMLSKIDLDQFSAVLFEHTRWPRSIDFVKANFPNIRVIVRAHNAEFFHALDKIFAFVLLNDSRISIRKIIIILKMLLDTLKSLYLDYKCANLCDIVFSCNETESRDYWKYLAPSTKIISVNTYTDSIFILKKIKHKKSKSDKIQILFVGSILPTYFNDHTLKILSKEISLADTQLAKKCNIKVTGKFSHDYFVANQKLQILGVVQDPYVEMNNADIIIILSPYGRGIKTRIYEALYLNKVVIVNKKIFERLPELLKKHTNPWAGKSGTFVKEALRVHGEHSESNSRRNDLQRYKLISEKNFKSGFNKYV